MLKEIIVKDIVSQKIKVELMDHETILIFQRNPRTKKYEKIDPFITIKQHPYGASKIYLVVPFWDYNKNIRTITTMQRLVYQAFKGDIPKGMCVDHINNDSLDNRPENLQLLTHKQNINKRKYNGANQYKNSIKK